MRCCNTLGNDSRLPLSKRCMPRGQGLKARSPKGYGRLDSDALVMWEKRKDRKSTRLNSSHQIISYAVFCLKKKKKSQPDETTRPPRGDRTHRAQPAKYPNVE